MQAFKMIKVRLIFIDILSDTNVLREDGETWFDGCRQCSCISGKEMCSLIRCSPFSCSNPIINSTSSCCPFCPGTYLSYVTILPITNEEYK